MIDLTMVTNGYRSVEEVVVLGPGVRDCLDLQNLMSSLCKMPRLRGC
jgi:hypothetical protein